MKRRSSTHGLRYSIHALRMEMRALPEKFSESWHWQDEQRRDHCRASIYRLLTELSLLGSNAAERQRNERLQKLHFRLQLHAATLEKRRAALAELAKLEQMQWRSGFEKALAQIAVEFGGKKAEQVSA